MSEDYQNALPVGAEIDSYRIERVLGEGGFGITYLVCELNLGKFYAIKELLPDGIAVRQGGATTVSAKNKGSVEDFVATRKYFISEARILAGMNHPAVVKVHRLMEANGTCYMVMDYIEGDTLGDYLKKRGGMFNGVNEFQQIFYPLMEGLEVLHGQGIIHRDIKPGNIMVKPDGSPVLLDFGAATQTQSKTVTITQMLSAGYSPFEQYTSRAKQGPYTDIYALGATMHKAITGNKPDDSSDRMYADAYQALTQTRAYLKTYGSELLGAVDAALRMDPVQRPQTVGAWRRMLNEGPGELPAKQKQDTFFLDASTDFDAIKNGDIRSGRKKRKVFLLSVMGLVLVAALSWAIHTMVAELDKQREQMVQIQQEAEAQRLKKQEEVANKQKSKAQELLEIKKKLAEMESQNEALSLAEQREQEARLEAMQEAEAQRLTAQNIQEGIEALESARDLFEIGVALPRDFFDQVDKDDLRSLAETGHAQAQFLWGFAHVPSLGLLDNESEAVKWIRKAAEQGNAWGMTQLGLMYAQGQGLIKDEGEAVRWYRKAAEQGDAWGRAQLGLMYEHGRGVDKNEREAERWYRKAAKQGNAGGQYQLGRAYASGKGVTKNPKEALYWYRRAAEQGFAEAQAALGRAYANGEGISKNHEAALEWLRMARANGADCDADISAINDQIAAQEAAAKRKEAAARNSNTTQSNRGSPPKTVTPSRIPLATKVPGQPGYVFSPYNNQIMDVRGLSSGALKRDSGSGDKFFRVP